MVNVVLCEPEINATFDIMLHVASLATKTITRETDNIDKHFRSPYSRAERKMLQNFCHFGVIVPLSDFTKFAVTTAIKKLM